MINAQPKEKTQLINTSQHNHHSLFRVVNVSWQHWHHGSSCSRDLNIMQPSSTHPRPRWSVNVFVALVTSSNGLTYYLVHFPNLDWWIHSHKSYHVLSLSYGRNLIQGTTSLGLHPWSALVLSLANLEKKRSRPNRVPPVTHLWLCLLHRIFVGRIDEWIMGWSKEWEDVLIVFNYCII